MGEYQTVGGYTYRLRGDGVKEYQTRDDAERRAAELTKLWEDTDGDEGGNAYAIASGGGFVVKFMRMDMTGRFVP